MHFFSLFFFFFFFFNDTATTEIYTLSLHERSSDLCFDILNVGSRGDRCGRPISINLREIDEGLSRRGGDRKSTRLNSSHLVISYAVFCLKKKKKTGYCVDMRAHRALST